MEEFVEKLVNNGGTLMGRYQITGKTIVFTSTDPEVTGRIIIGEDQLALVSRNRYFVRIDYGKVEILIVPTKNQYTGTFTAGIMDIILKGDQKILVEEIKKALKTIMVQKA